MARCLVLVALIVAFVGCERSVDTEDPAWLSAPKPAGAPILAPPPREWNAEVEWGSGMPAGTTYNVKFDRSGRMKAERRGLPIVTGGKLTTVVHDVTLATADVASLHELVERGIRGVDLSSAQGSMIDGRYVRLYLWEGTVVIAAHLNSLGTEKEQGSEVTRLISDVSRRLPEGFVR